MSIRRRSTTSKPPVIATRVAQPVCTENPKPARGDAIGRCSTGASGAGKRDGLLISHACARRRAWHLPQHAAAAFRAVRRAGSSGIRDWTAGASHPRECASVVPPTGHRTAPAPTLLKRSAGAVTSMLQSTVESPDRAHPRAEGLSTARRAYLDALVERAR